MCLLPLSCVFLANYVPKCQMSSGPYGPLFFYTAQSDSQIRQRFPLEYNFNFVNSRAKWPPNPGVSPEQSHVNFHTFWTLQQQKWRIDFHVRGLEKFSTIDSNVQVILLLQVCVVVSM